MATVIRMKRGGRTHAPYYRVVVMDSRSRSRGVEVEQIGIYHPCARPEPRIEIDRDKTMEWLQKGAKPSDTARSIFSKQGIMAQFAALRDGKAPVETVETAEEAPAEEATESAEA